MKRLGPVVLAVAVLGGCGTPASMPRPDTPSITGVIAVGDSITEADSPDFDAGDLGPGSWATYAEGDGVRVLGGWAHAGATSQDMLDGVTEQEAEGGENRPDVLVLMAGNNDILNGMPYSQLRDNLVQIAQVVSARRVVLSTLAPDDSVTPQVQAFNAQLPALAKEQGWELVDPMTGVRADDGSYREGLSDDGEHPTNEGAKLIGEALHPALTG